MNLKKIESPLVIVDETKARRNIERIARKAKDSQTELRAHVKTCQSGAVAEWLREYGVHKITVSSVDMAEYFVPFGWSDITMAVPVNIHQIDRINTLAKNLNFHVITESPFTALKLSEQITNPLNVWIEIDTGYHRTGIAVQDVPKFLEIADIIQKSSHLVLTGILTHAGHVYNSSSPSEILSVHSAAVEALNKGDFEGFLKLVRESGNSSSKWLQNLYSSTNVKEQGITLALALTEKYISEIKMGACRVHGGGFAGTIQVFLPVEAVLKFIDFIESVFGDGKVVVLDTRSYGSLYLNRFLK
ncbi:alanine racemase [Acidobacteriota bacterium]